ncbi:MAG: SMI1/KNR4 family protein [Phycisphaerae bacterium]|nr:SMI1/KNR4 family protein [Phycisphaerae bacterium]
MSDYWDFIKDFYSKPGVFSCSNRGACNKNSEIAVQHLLLLPPDKSESDKLQKLIKNDFLKWVKFELPPSYLKFFSFTNGGIFFTQIFDESINSGFGLYSSNEVKEHHDEVIKWLEDMFDEDAYVFDEGDEKEKEICRQWLSNILVIGEEIQSGNYIAIDFNRTKDGLESPIIFIDHELPFSYADVEDDDPILAKSVDELLFIAAQDPAEFLMKKLGATACYSGEPDEQWYPEKYRVVE